MNNEERKADAEEVRRWVDGAARVLQAAASPTYTDPMEASRAVRALVGEEVLCQVGLALERLAAPTEVVVEPGEYVHAAGYLLGEMQRSTPCTAEDLPARVAMVLRALVDGSTQAFGPQAEE